MVWRSRVSPFESTFPVHIRDKTAKYLRTEAHRNVKMVSFERKYPKLKDDIVWLIEAALIKSAGVDFYLFKTAGVLTPLSPVPTAPLQLIVRCVPSFRGRHRDEQVKMNKTLWIFSLHITNVNFLFVSQYWCLNLFLSISFSFLFFCM